MNLVCRSYSEFQNEQNQRVRVMGLASPAASIEIKTINNNEVLFEVGKSYNVNFSAEGTIPPEYKGLTGLQGGKK